MNPMRATIQIRTPRFESHRNGISGRRFVVAVFEVKWDPGKWLSMVAVIPDPLDDDTGLLRDDWPQACPECYVLNVFGLVQGLITPGEWPMGNSWRGDWYADALRPHLKQWAERRSE